MTEDPSSRRAMLALLAGVPLAAGGAALAQSPGGPRLGKGEVNVRDFGAVGDGVTDDRAAFLAAIASVSENEWSIGGRPAHAGGARIRVPPGNYFLSDSIDLKRTVIIEGDAGGQSGGFATVLTFAAGRHGIIIDRRDTIGGNRVEASPTGGADGTILQNLALLSKGGGEGHGIFAKARFVARDLFIAGFGGNGYHVSATAGAGGEKEGNANSFQILGGRIERCGGDGVHVVGADANAGLIQAVDSSANGGWGFRDRSFLGNTYVACHAADNKAGPYFSDNANARNLYVGCYSESGQPRSQLTSPAFVVGGLHGAGITGTAAMIVARFGALHSAGFYSESGGLSVHLGAEEGSGSCLEITDQVAAPSAWRLRRSSEDLRFDYGNLDTAVSFAVTGPATKASFGGDKGVPHVFAVPRLGLGVGGNARLISCGDGPPASGFHARGERIYYSAPSAGGREGVVCVASGTPGQWKEFGAIAR